MSIFPCVKPAAFALACIFLTASLQAEDWFQFQGPRGNGTSPETRLLRG